MHATFKKSKPVEVQRSLRKTIKGAKYVGPGLSIGLKQLQEARRAVREIASSLILMTLVPRLVHFLLRSQFQKHNLSTSFGIYLLKIYLKVIANNTLN